MAVRSGSIFSNLKENLKFLAQGAYNLLKPSFLAKNLVLNVMSNP
jgi:hypothetical protein